MNRVILEPMIPFNDILYINCFYSSLIPVVRYFHREVGCLLANDVIVYKKHEGRNIPGIDIAYLQQEALEKVLTNLGIAVENKARSEGIINDVLCALVKRRPVIAWIDCFFEPVRKDTYRKTHLGHTLLVHGFSEQEQICNIIEHKHRDSLTYTKQILGFQNIADAYDGFLENYSSDANRPTYYEYYLGKRFEELQPGYKNILGALVVFMQNMYSRKDAIFDGLNYLKDFADKVQSICCEPFLAEYVEYLIVKLNNVINAKIAEKYKLLILNIRNYSDIAPNILDEVVMHWSSIRVILARFMYSGKYKNEEIKSVLREIKQVYEREYIYHIEIFSLFDKITDNCK